MNHTIEFTTVELMLISEAINNKCYFNHVDNNLSKEIIDKINKVIHRDLSE